MSKVKKGANKGKTVLYKWDMRKCPLCGHVWERKRDYAEKKRCKWCKAMPVAKCDYCHKNIPVDMDYKHTLDCAVYKTFYLGLSSDRRHRYRRPNGIPIPMF